MNNFTIVNETSEEINELIEVEKLVNFALKYLNLENTIFNIIIVDEEKIQELNKTYRGKDSVTDVISFALEDDDTFINTDFRVLGDIYICLKRAKDQSIEYGHSFLREISFLTIHGLLHLLGYDHMVKEEEKVMFELQERILDAYGIKR
jgi:probable rRNA maturation factor